MSEETTTAPARRRSLKLWHLTRKDDYGYGTNIEFLVVAGLHQEARFLASDSVRATDRHVWLDPRVSACQEIGVAAKSFVKPEILISVYHGE